MPATLREQPLGVSCVFSDGSPAELSLHAPGGAQLGRDLLVGLVELVHPHGTVDKASTVNHYLRAARHMVATLAGQGFVGGAGELTRAKLAEYWMAATVPVEACTRAMLAGFDVATAGLSAPVRELVEGRAFNPQRFRRSLPPYPEAEWSRLGQACASTVEESFAAHRAALGAAARGTDPAVGGWSGDNLSWLLARRGPSTLVQVATHVGISTRAARNQGGFGQASRALFPHMDVTVAYLLGFGMSSGVVPDGVADLVVGDIDWAGDASVLLSYVKGRTGPESLTLGRRAVRLLEQWLSHSALLRAFVPTGQARQLWLGVNQEGSRSVSAGPVQRNVVHRWAVSHNLTDSDGRPLKIARHRIRTTHLSLRDKRSWAGNPRATIDPNHGPAIEGDHYLSAATPAQRRAVETIIADAQHDLVRRAQPPTVLIGDDIAALAGAWPTMVAGLDRDDIVGDASVLAELVGGQRDVFVAACADQLSGLHGPKGQPCPARPWVCLVCPLAVFAPRHAGNLLRLKAFFARQWQAMPANQFMSVFGPYARATDRILDRYQPAVLGAAAGGVAGNDAELPLRPEELSR
ncbi:MAG: hypothetical protein M0005_15020 [Actinomycetota bacterium]|jgi:hypothetical protein|nr:hypothetical protein [Actinomycetota bacterium]